LNPISLLQKEIATSGWTSILTNALDIFLVAYAIYWLMQLTKRTKAFLIILGLFVFLILAKVTEWLHLQTLNFIARQLMPLGPAAIVFLFYPELRNVLENMGKVAWSGRGLALISTKDDFTSNLIPTIVNAVCSMSAKKTGALIVIERETLLDSVVLTGTILNANVSSDLLETIFYPGNPLHDGAVIIKGERILAAATTLPLSESASTVTTIHTRHKAALGISEITDSSAIVVSEETGTISVAFEGKLHRGLNEESLTRWLRITTGLESKVKRADTARRVFAPIRKAGIRKK
jgi:diadenylate cyclase